VRVAPLPTETAVTMNSKAIQRELITHLPKLRAFAISLCGNADLADDLLQESILKAWKHLDSFEEGTNLRAWLFTILRNTFFSERRRQRPEAIDEEAVEKLGKAPEQYGWMESRDLLKALMQLSPEHREAIILVGAEGYSYEETAEICGCAVGTVKSRVNRARIRLQDLLDKPPAAASAEHALSVSASPNGASAATPHGAFCDAPPKRDVPDERSAEPELQAARLAG
jgi:RNA polymerase sigma-70 factor, ECF subfamily